MLSYSGNCTVVISFPPITVRGRQIPLHRPNVTLVGTFACIILCISDSNSH